MAMNPVLEAIQSTPALRAAREACDGRGQVLIEGLCSPARGPTIAALFLSLGRQMLLVAPSEEQADKLYHDLAAILGSERVHLFPAIEMIVLEDVGIDAEAAMDRLNALCALLRGQHDLVVTSVNALLLDLVPRDVLAAHERELVVGQELDFEEFKRSLQLAGYRRAELTVEPGEFSVRGGIVDLYPPTAQYPLRVEFFGDEIESIREFEPATQRSRRELKRARFGAASEVLLPPEGGAAAAQAIEQRLAEELDALEQAGRGEVAEKLAAKVREHTDALRDGRPLAGAVYYLPLMFAKLSSLADYLADDAVVVIDDPLRVEAQCAELRAELCRIYEQRVARGELLRLPREPFRTFAEVVKLLAERATIYTAALSPTISWARLRRRVAVNSAPAETFRGQFDILGEQIDEWLAAGLSVVLSTSQTKRVRELVRLKSGAEVRELDDGAQLDGGVYVGTLPLSAGFRLPEARLAVLTDREIFGYQRAVMPPRRRRDEVKLTSLADLRVGDLVVHIHHGIGRYAGIVKKTIDGVERDYLQIDYAEGDKLFVPTPQIDRVQKYIGGEGAAPRIHRLSESTWQRVRRRAKRSTEKLARELLRIYAMRAQAEGYAFSPDQPWQLEVESAFIYEETPDQLRAIADVKRDMETPRPMDRLVCGDVGFGKTEVAVRAALKAVLDGKQVAVLAPTTVLAQQHLNTFLERLGAYPIRIELLSRFRTREQQRRIVEELALGRVDIVIGTHRILSEDVQFKDLGLLVIDEEQRFGVMHKEKLKKLAAHVDVLTLTATPIPRTLYMALSGIRDMSVINDPPQGRVAIRTFCLEENDEVIREAIVRELEREGQVYFVHNRVQSIEYAARRVKKLVPQARIAVAHGQMSEDRLERVMMDFYAGEYDVLVCTSIIESGLDVPNVNTIIVQDADRFGLAQLYQLRGRVGRSTRQAYAYFLYRYPHRMTREAEERLLAIKEFTELGSGFKIAMRDLEIRGAGNLLGPEQHGHIVAVGFELYCQMLSEAVRQLKGEKVDRSDLPPVELPIDAYLPEDYIASEGHRLDLYRRISDVREHEALEEIAAEIRDRFGPLPEEAQNLIRLLRLRIMLAERGLFQAPAEPAILLLRAAEDRPRELSPFEQSAVYRFARRYLRKIVRAVYTTGRRVLVRFVNATPAQKLKIMEGVLSCIAPLDEEPWRASRAPQARPSAGGARAPR